MPSEPEGTRFSFSYGIDQRRNEYVMEQLKAYNMAHASPLVPALDELPVAAPLEIYALDNTGAVVGGLIGRTHSIREWLEISILWVEEVLRGQGLGRRLVQQAEQEAMARGCHYARLATSDFQAPGFYEKMGYTLYGKLDNCPPGITNYYFNKTLVKQAPPQFPPHPNDEGIG